jgi:hypothetical protein
MHGRCTSKRSLRFWQYQPTVEAIPMWVAIHCNINEGKKLELPRIEVQAAGEEWTLDPGDFVVEHPNGTPFVLSEGEFHQMFDMCAEVAPR